MVEQSLQLSLIFSSLSDPTRRDILKRVAKEEMTISQIAEPYKLTFAAISKHLMILQKAKLIVKKREGKQQVVTFAPETVKDAASYLKEYEKIWNDRFDRLEHYLSSLPPES